MRLQEAWMFAVALLLVTGMPGCSAKPEGGAKPEDVAEPDRGAERDRGAEKDRAVEPDGGAEPDGGQEATIAEIKAAIAEIEKAGGWVLADQRRPGKPVVDVSLEATSVTDAGLVHLKELTKLPTVDLSGTKVTDAGLVHLKGLPQLQSLTLWETKVTDAGVKKLQQTLPNCKISH